MRPHLTECEAGLTGPAIPFAGLGFSPDRAEPPGLLVCLVRDRIGLRPARMGGAPIGNMLPLAVRAKLPRAFKCQRPSCRPEYPVRRVTSRGGSGGRHWTSPMFVYRTRGEAERMGARDVGFVREHGIKLGLSGVAVEASAGGRRRPSNSGAEKARRRRTTL